MAKESKTIAVAKKFISPIREFIADSRAVGIVLISCTFISLIISNSSWAESYIDFWEMDVHLPVPKLNLPHTVTHIINDALMTLFFVLAGLEIKRELLVGELKSVKKSMLPIFAAMGGMIVPATIFLLWNGGTALDRGWGIPMATDIAFSLGILSLLGKRAPLSLKIFLTALAIIDDVGGIITIAIFYASEIDYTYLFMGGGMLFILTLMNLLKVKRYYLYFVLGVVMWYFIFNSGVHATISGVLLALTIPLRKIDMLEHRLHDPVNFIIMPLFALANTAIILPDSFSFILTSPVNHGIFTGLVLGKPVGITLFCMLAVIFRIASLPKGLTWKHIFGVGLIAGIGFTISIFMATLAYTALPGIVIVAKVSIIAASLAAGLLGFIYLRLIPITKVNQPNAD